MPGTTEPIQRSRRRFVQGGLVAGAGLLVGFRWAPAGRRASLTEADELAPNAFVRIGVDDTVTVIAKHIEFGQGTHTGLATILAEELDAEWTQVRVEDAPADVTRYANLAFGAQGTGGSTAMANSWQQLREAGAKARALLVHAAAARWDVEERAIVVEDGTLEHPPTGRKGRFADFVREAAELPVPENVTLKDPKDFKLIGQRVPRVDVAGKTDGSARFTIDVDREGMLTAVIARSPRFGGKVESFDAAAAKQVRGVEDVVQVPTGIAVLARGYWPATQGRDALKIEWDDSAAEMRGSEQLFAEYCELAGTPGVSVRNDGDVEAALAGAARVLEADYEFPYLAHAPMEPLDCVIELSNGGCEVWAGSQLQTIDQMVVAQTLGLPMEKVQIHTLLGGGSFGRRATPDGDVFGEAAAIAKAIEGRAPVKLVWTREDDIRGGRYRPLYVHRLRAGLDASGEIVAWHHRIVGQSILAGSAFEAALAENGIDTTSVEGAGDLPYAIPNLGVELHTTEVGVPVLWWRSVGHTHNAFSTETFLDELIRAGGGDPVEARRKLLARYPRHRAVLELAAGKAGWGKPLPAGRARGIAVHESFQSFVAQVAEVSVGDDGMPIVHRVVCAVDCGIAINPDNIVAQMEGGLGFGLGAALYSELELKDGVPAQSNFDDYLSLSISEMPGVEVYIVKSDEAPTGVGEPGVPPIAPAVANAYAQLTGEHVRRLPFTRAVS